MIVSVLPSDAAPRALIDFLAPVRFSTVMLNYNSKPGPGRMPFMLTATPDMSTLPALRDMLAAVGLQPGDVALRTSGAGAIALGVTKATTLALSAPFTEPPTLTFGINVNAATRSAVVSGSFACKLAIDVLDAPLGLYLSAEVRGGPSGTALALEGQTTTTATIKGVSWVKFGVLRAQGAMTVVPATAVTQMQLAGSVTIAGATGTGVLVVRGSSTEV